MGMFRFRSVRWRRVVLGVEWLLLWVFVVGWIVLIVWAIGRGDRGPNKYGPNPMLPISLEERNY